MSELTKELKQSRSSRFSDMWASIYSNKAALTGLVIIALLVVCAITVAICDALGIQILPYDPNLADMDNAFVAPCAEHWFGTDQLGRDIFSRVLVGAQISLAAGVFANNRYGTKAFSASSTDIVLMQNIEHA